MYRRLASAVFSFFRILWNMMHLLYFLLRTESQLNLRPWIERPWNNARVESHLNEKCGKNFEGTFFNCTSLSSFVCLFRKKTKMSRNLNYLVESFIFSFFPLSAPFWGPWSFQALKPKGNNQGFELMTESAIWSVKVWIFKRFFCWYTSNLI